MNRLQVGDECYVRNHEGKIIKAKYIGPYFCKFANDRNAHLISIGLWQCVASKQKPWFDPFGADFFPRVRLVYPFPCVKELAI